MADNNNTKDDRNKLSAVWNAAPSGIELDDKITIIENWSYEALKYLPPWIMPEAIESDGYYFVAHSRKDFKIVYKDILRLESVGVDIWYDRSMEPGRNWQEIAERMMNRQECKGVIVYGTVNSMASKPVQIELLVADKLGKNIIFINHGEDLKTTAAKDLYKEAKKALEADGAREETSEEDGKRVNDFEELLDRIGNANITYIDLSFPAARKKELLDKIKSEDILRYGNRLWDDVAITGVKYLGVKSVKIPEKVTIGEKEYNVTAIEACAFANCLALERIELPKHLKRIGEHAFFGCMSLMKLHLGEEVWFVAENAFENCENLEEVTVAEGNEYIIVKDRVHYIRQLYGDKFGMFFVPRDLKGAITLLDGLKTIKPYAFARRDGITSVTIPDSVMSIGEWAFNRCTSLTSVIIPDSVMSIGERAFNNCSKLVEVCNKSSLDITTGNYAGNDVDNFARHIYTEDGGSWFSDTEDGFRFLWDGETGYLVAYFGDETELTLPDGFTAYDGTEVTNYQINDFAFADCESLTSVTIPNSVTNIGQNAFSGCYNLKSVIIPNSVKGIGRSAFSGCHDLKYNEYDNALYLGNEENPYLVLITAKDELIASIAINGVTKLIYSDAFSYCTSLTSVTIPDGVTSIGQFAFAFCALTAVTIPNSVRNIGANTFYGCTPLENITYSGTVEQWRELTTQCCRWARHCPCEVVKCKDGEVPVTEHDRVSIYDLEFDIEEPDGDEEE